MQPELPLRIGLQRQRSGAHLEDRGARVATKHVGIGALGQAHGLEREGRQHGIAVSVDEGERADHAVSRRDEVDRAVSRGRALDFGQ